MRTVIADLGHNSLKPLTYTRSSTDIEAGGQTLHEHIQEGLELEKTTVLVPKYLEEVTRKNSELYEIDREVNERPEGEYLLYNSTVIPNEEIREKVGGLEEGEALYYEGVFVAGVTNQWRAHEDVDEVVEDFERVELDEAPIVLEYPWDIVGHNGELIEASFPGEEIKGEISDEAEVIGDGGLFIGDGAEVSANVTLDTSGGPVYIGSGTKVWPNSRIDGPAYIGSNTKIGAGQNAVIHENTYIGDVCRAGGELEDVVINSFTNKYHCGFLGHAVVGSWVNFGAGTTNSDLKNTYGTVKVEHPVDGTIDAGLKVGATIGDHTKMDIQTGIYTGKMIGPVARASGKVTGNVEPFTWQHMDTDNDYIVDKAVEHVERMMNRRKDYLPEDYIKAHRKLVKQLRSD